MWKNVCLFVGRVQIRSNEEGVNTDISGVVF